MDDPLAVGRFQTEAGLYGDVDQRERRRGGRSRSGKPLFESLSVEQFHGDERLALILLNVVDGTDVRVVEARRGLGLPLETLKRNGVADELYRQKFQGGAAAQLPILGAGNP